MDAPSILLIENSPDDAKLIVDALAGVVARDQIALCVDGADALDFFHCRGIYAQCIQTELPAFVLLNLDLPQVAGLDVLREIRSHPPTRLVPVTILSASATQADIRAAAQLGANSYVRKATDGRQMRETIATLALYWLQLNVPPPTSARQ